MSLEDDIVAALDYIDPDRWQRQRILTVLEEQVRCVADNYPPREAAGILCRVVARAAPALSDAEVLQVARDYLDGRGMGRLGAEGRIVEMLYAYADRSERLSACRRFAERQKAILDEEKEIQAALAAHRWKGERGPDVEALEQRLWALSAEKACATPPMLPEEYKRETEARARVVGACERKRAERVFEQLYDLYGPPPPRDRSSGAWGDRPTPPESRRAAAPSPAPPAAAVSEPLLAELRDLKKRLADLAAVPVPPAADPAPSPVDAAAVARLREELDALRQEVRRREAPAPSAPAALSPERIEEMIREALARAGAGGDPAAQIQTILPAKKKDDPRGDVIEI